MRIDLKNISRVVGVAVPLVFGLVVGRLLAPWLPQFAAWVHTMGAWAPFAFVGAYVAIVLLMLPAFLLTMVAGAVFGVVEGVALVITGAIIGGTLAFLLGRYVARDFVAKRVAQNPKLSAARRYTREVARFRARHFRTGTHRACLRRVWECLGRGTASRWFVADFRKDSDRWRDRHHRPRAVPYAHCATRLERSRSRPSPDRRPVGARRVIGS